MPSVSTAISRAGLAALVCGNLGDSTLAQEFEVPDPPTLEIECAPPAPEAGTVPVNPLADGSWTQPRANRHLTGRSPLVGNITCPKQLWSYDLAARRGTAVSIQPGGGSSELRLPTSGNFGNYFQMREDFDYEGIFYDLNGDGTRRAPAFERDFRILEPTPEEPGFRRVTCSSDKLGLTTDRETEIWCGLQIFDGQNWVNDWIVDGPLEGREEDGGHPIIGDFDADGELEAGIKDWFFMHVLDLADGDLEHSFEIRDRDAACTFGMDCVSGRSYGWWGAFNLDADPKLEFVILGDLEQFVMVVGWDGDQLRQQWLHRVEPGTSNPTAQLVTGVNPVVDVDGDLRPEVVFSVLNDDGDNQWHVYVRDGISGEVELDLPGARLEGLGDIDGDGTHELLVALADFPGVPEFDEIRILSLSNGEQNEVWSASATGFQQHEFPSLPVNVHSRSFFGLRTAFVREQWTGGNPVFMTREKASGGMIKLRVHQSTDGQIQEIGALTGPDLSVFAFSDRSPERGILVRAVAQDEAQSRLQLEGVTGTVEQSGRVQLEDDLVARVGLQWLNEAGLMGGSVVGRLEPGAQPTVVANGFGEQVHALKINDTDSPEVRWIEPGRGMRTEGAAPTESVLLADVNGTGYPAVIVAVTNGIGLGEIRALDAGGDISWRRSLRVRGAVPPDNTSGITAWAAGNFTSTGHEDIIVSYRTATQHSSHMRLLLGPSGERGWLQNSAGICPFDGVRATGAGSGLVASVDWDGDGLDEALSMPRGTLVIHDGNDGAILQRNFTHGFCNLPPLFGEGIFNGKGAGAILDDGSGVPDRFLFAGHPDLLGVVRFDGQQIWHTDPSVAVPPDRSLQGIADLDGDGDLEIVSVGDRLGGDRRIRAYDAANGNVRWSLPLPLPVIDGESLCTQIDRRTSHVATGDIDGDGRDEAVFGVCNFLYALGENDAGSGELLWQVRFPNHEFDAALAEPVIADVRGYGRPQIVVNTFSGYMYGLGVEEEPNPFRINAGISAAWFDSGHDGEGFLIEILDDDQAVIYWFTYDKNGKQRWFVGFGTVLGATIEVSDFFEATGAMFGAGFDPDAVSLNRVGNGIFEFSDCDGGTADYQIDGEFGHQDIGRLTTLQGVPCAETKGGNNVRSGAWYGGAERDGEGFLVQILGAGALVVWFTYGLNGEQMWLIGSGDVAGDEIVIDEMVITSGGRFGPDFDPAEVERQFWGSLTLRLDCDSGEVEWSAEDPDFGSGSYPLVRLSRIAGTSCSQSAGAAP